ncbi:CD109 antigen [Mytilus galloprovincialis]|uniref:CD109 antigen n=1 Tax=Mytilus galloprovincialis TaxID=29158 RepID=A0A8B6HAP0_MYTGA|nr:CD109 antigen [Mytilus galloprovincialis]
MSPQVLARDTLVSSSILDGSQQKDYNFSIPVTRNMTPEAQIIAYFVQLDGEIVLDYEYITVNGRFENTVTVRFDRATAKPGDNITTTIKADPNSYVCMIGRDKSVSILSKTNDITENTIPETFTLIIKTGMTTQRRRKEPALEQNFQYMMLTDATVYQYQKPIYPLYTTTTRKFETLNPDVDLGGGRFNNMKHNLHTVFNTPQPGFVIPTKLQVPKPRIRKTFSETWMWLCSYTQGNGYVNMTTVLPDTITTWVGSAFAVNKDNGFSLSTSSAQITGFKEFFISMNFPYSVVRGEEVSLQVDVFNYKSDGMAVMFILRKSKDFNNILRSFDGSKQLISKTQTESFFVAPGEVASVFFPIIPETNGPINIEVTAQSFTAADGVRRQLLVEPEGIPQEHNTPIYFGVDKGHPRNKDVPISFPALVVSGSQRIRVSVTGDVMGPTLKNLEQLLRLPTGCGEQTMLGLAPDVFVAHYLKETNQLTKELENNLKTYIEKGYQRELTFQRKDGSFSAFGNRDSAGSMWLSAFVAKTFSKAKRHIFIDNTVLEKTIHWMINKQSSDGSFPEPGRVIHKNMQGGSVNGQSLTAFVLIALQENVILTGPIHSRIVEASRKAKQYLEQHITNVNDAYGLSIASYALSVSGSLAFNRIFDKLNRLAIVKGDTKYWNNSPSPAPGKYRSPIDIEMTAYALLTYAHLKSTGDGSDVLRWLVTQRNSNGGFMSTQDTVIALESLSEFNVLIRSQQLNMTVSVTAGPQVKQFTVNTLNALVLQAAELQQPFPSKVQIQASGHGIALVDVAVFYNVEKEHRKRELPSFDISIRIMQQTIDLIELKICTRWLLGGSSGMTVQEIGIPTGFEPKTEEISHMSVVKKIEEENKKVVLYFDEISHNPICITMKAIRTGLVSKLKPSAVRVYDYYEPGSNWAYSDDLNREKAN